MNRLGVTRREAAILVGALCALAVGLILVEGRLPGQGTSPLEPPLSLHSSGPRGARALGLWLDALGFDARSIELRPFSVEPSTGALLLLAPTTELSDDQVASVVGWLEQGGTLVLVGERPNKLVARLGADVVAGERIDEALPLQPLFGGSVGPMRADTAARLTLNDPAWVPLFGAGGDAVAAVRRVGRGRAYLFATIAPFTNEGLRRPESAALVLSVLGQLPTGARVAFDEYHHGLTEHGTLALRLLGDPWGWAVLYLFALVFAYLGLRGRRFGKVAGGALIPPRRAQREYVATVATMLRQGGHLDHLRRRYLSQLTRQLGRRFGVSPDLAPEVFAAALARRRPAAAALAAPLAELGGARRLDERALLRLLRRTEQLKSESLGV